MRTTFRHFVVLAGGFILTACAEEPRTVTAPGGRAPSFAARAGSPSVSVVDVTRDLEAQNESPLAANPLNPDNLLTGNNDFNLNDGCGFNVSFNGGRTWTPTLPDGFIPGLTKFTNDPSVPGTGVYDVAGDPAVAFGRDGMAYFACQAFNVTPPFQIALFVSRSTDGGLTWPDGINTKPVQVSTWTGNGKAKGSEGQFPDHESIAVDESPRSPFSGSVYVTWVQFNGFGRSPVQVSFSRDGGQTFSLPISVTTGPISENQDARIAIGPTGTLYLTFDNGLKGGTGGMVNFVTVSTDGGMTWSKPTQFSRYNNPVCLFPPFCFNITGGAFRGPGSYPAPAFDPVSGRLDVAYADIDTDRRAKIFFTSALADQVTKSAQWSTPVAVAPGTGDRFGAELSAAANGRLDLSFYDRSYSGNALVDVTYATSSDGGTTWTTARVTNSGFDPSQGFPFIGDYNGIVSLSGHAGMVWTGPATTRGVTNLDIFFGSARL